MMWVTQRNNIVDYIVRTSTRKTKIGYILLSLRKQMRSQVETEEYIARPHLDWQTIAPRTPLRTEFTCISKSLAFITIYRPYFITVRRGPEQFSEHISDHTLNPCSGIAMVDLRHIDQQLFPLIFLPHR
ncbi:hypothetical protein BED46_041195 [Burkholderia contaminans]|uniref:Uncharacterized protein n=1 Tax=Burkholderia contaminans LMG 23361 TaxID=1334628 RepID=A0ABD4AQY7_9BURK|nr:hypothetical protein WR31_18470 [Burkholderia contaminans LMG 23361]ODN25140.1 hypothetical protein BGI28_20495 [Burkholderia contaminans]OMI77844.1 hypothetical protein BED46_041195 [Burkholderia contaminans]